MSHLTRTKTFTNGGRIYPSDLDDLQDDVDAFVNALRDDVDSLKTPEAWHVIGAGGEPAFGSGWGNITFVGPPTSTSPAAFYVDGAGVVRLRGHIQSGSSTAAIFTLPVGYRPAVRQRFAVAGVEAAVAKVLIVQVDTDGTVTRTSAPGSGANELWLDTIAFRIV